MSTVFEDADRYLNSKAAGWTDPEVDPYQMIRDLIDAEGATLEDTVAQDTYDELEAEKTTLEERVKELEDEDWVMKKASVTTLMIALGEAIAREKIDAIVTAKSHQSIDHAAAVESLTDEVKRLRKQVARKPRAKKIQPTQIPATEVAGQETP